MTRPAGGYLRTLERMEKALRDYLEQTPEVPGSPGSGPVLPAPVSLGRAIEQITAIEEALARAELHAAGIENLLQTEADTFAAWLETLGRVSGQLRTWAGTGNLPE